METIYFIIDWLKEYGDVLGGVGSIFAIITLIATNGKLIMARLRGEAYASPLHAEDQTDTSKAFKPNTGLKSNTMARGMFAIRKSTDVKSLAVMPIEALGAVDAVFIAGLREALIIDLSNAGFVLPEVTPQSASILDDGDLTEGQTGVALRDQTMTAEDVSALFVRHALKIIIRSSGDITRANIQVISDQGMIVYSNRLDLDPKQGIIEEERAANIVAAALKDALLTSKRDRADKTIAAGAEQSARSRIPDTRQDLAIAFSPKNRLLTALFLLPPMGILGVHRFYIGRPFTGFLYFMTVGFFIAGWIMDIALLAAGVLADGKGRPVVFWKRARMRAEIAGNPIDKE